MQHLLCDTRITHTVASSLNEDLKAMQLELYFTRIIKQCMPWTQANFTETDQTNCSDAIVKQSVSSKMKYG